MDVGFEQGMDIPIYYDPMIAKLVTFGADRAEAIARMLRAIAEYQITGIETTLPFGAYVLRHPAVVSAVLGTRSPSEVRRNVASYSVPPPPSLWEALRAEGVPMPEDAA